MNNEYAIECMEVRIRNLVVQKTTSPKGYHKDIDEKIDELQSAIKQLSKKPVSPLNEDKIREIMSKYLKPNMLEWTHAIDKDKPVSSCIQTEKEYDDCVKELSTLTPKAKIKKLEDRVLELTILKDTYEDWNKKLKAKQFNEAEIRKKIKIFLKDNIREELFYVLPFEDLIKQLSTFTSKAQGEVEKGKPSICDEIETEVNKDEQ